VFGGFVGGQPTLDVGDQLGLVDRRLMAGLDEGHDGLAESIVGNPDGDSIGGSMGRVIKNTSLLSADDRAAMAAYLKSLPAVEGPPRPKKPPAEDKS